MNEIPKIVLEDPAACRLARGTNRRGDLLSEPIWRLKREPGKDLIVYGGSTFDQALSRLGLVDEYRLMIQLATLGPGSRCSRI